MEGLDGKAFDFSSNENTAGDSQAKVSLKLDTLPKTTAFSVNYWIKGGPNNNNVVMVVDGFLQRFTFGSNGENFFPCLEAGFSDGAVWYNKGFGWTTGKRNKTDGWQMVTYTVADNGKTKVYLNGVLQEVYEEEGYEDFKSHSAYDAGGGNYLNLFSDSVE